MADPMNVLDFQKMKDDARKISMVTCYDYSSARAVAASNIDCILVGDSLAMTMHGYSNHSFGHGRDDGPAHGRGGQRRGTKFIVADLPFLSIARASARRWMRFRS